MTRIKALLAAAVALCLVALGAVVAMPASAHTPKVTANCDKLVVDLKSYDTRGKNHVKVTLNGAVKADQDFASAYSQQFAAPDPYAAYTYEVVVTAWDDPDGKKGYTKTFTGSSTPCKPPVTKPSGSFTQQCTATGADVTIGQLSSGTYTNVVWTLTYGGQSKVVVAGEKVAVPPQVSLKLSYTADGGKSGTVQSGKSLKACPPVTKPSGSFTQKCTDTGAEVTIGQLDSGTYTNVVWTLSYGNQTTTVATGDKVAVPGEVQLALSYAAGQKTDIVQTEMSKKACPPPPVNPSGSYTVVCDDDGAVVTIGQLSNEAGVTWRLEVNGTAQPVASGNVVQVSGESDLALISTYQGQDSIEQEGKAPKACPPPPVVEPSGMFTTECTATGAQADIGTLTEGTATGGAFRLVSGSFSQTVTSGQQNVTVPASSTIKLEYVPAQGPAKELDSEQSPAACPPPPPTGEVTKTSVPATGTVVAPGQKIDYSVTVKNTGQVAITNAPVVDTLPTHVTAVPGTVSDSGQVSADGRTITWTVSLAVGASKTFTYQGLVAANAPAGSTQVNKATFLLKESTTTHTVGSRGLNVVKAVSPTGTVAFGDTLTYTLTVTTTGNLPQTNVVVTDPIPAGTTYTAGSATCDDDGPCSPSVANGVVTWSLGSMAAGATRTVSFRVTVDTPAEDEEGAIPAVTIVNSGAAASTEVPTTPSNEVETPVTAVKPVKEGPNQPGGETPEEEVPAAPTETGVLPQTGSGIPAAWLAGMAGLLVLMGIALVSVARPARRKG